MPGTKAGGLKAAAKIKERDPDFFHKIGKKGGAYRGPKGFALMPHELCVVYGRKGGRISRRGPKKTKLNDER